MTRLLKAFIETPAGSRRKHMHDEITLERLDSVSVPEPYPHAYGFLPDYMAADGECVDCYVIGEPGLESGALIEAKVVGLIDQWEAGAEDHKVLMVAAEAADELAPGEAERIMTFMRALFAPYPDMLVTVGPARNARAAMQYLTAFNAGPQ